MMASAGQGGAGLRGDQYYPPPPPPPRFPPPFPSPRHPYALAPSFLLLPSTTVAVSTLQPSTFSPFSTAVPLSPPRRLPSYESNCSAGETRLGYARFLPTLCVHVCVCVCVFVRKRTWRVHMWPPRTRGIVYRDRRYKAIRWSRIMHHVVLLLGISRRCVREWNARSMYLPRRISFFFRTGRILSIRFQFDRETCSFQWNWMIGVLLGQYSKKNLSFDEE